MSSTLRRAWLLTNIALTIALLPALFPNDGDGKASAVVAGAPAFTADALAASSTTSTTTELTTTTTAAPASTTTEAVVVAQAVKTTTTTAPPTTTTATRPPPPPPAPAPTGSESGRATWYDYKPGICAHRALPFGTVVTVNAVNGKSVRCTVGDRGPYVDGYVIDLHWREFEQLAPRSAGRIDVTITW